MKQVIEDVIARLRALPESEQEQAAQDLMRYLADVPTMAERATIAEGRLAYERGESIPLDQWRHEMGLGSR
jgi:hypothetical protein